MGARYYSDMVNVRTCVYRFYDRDGALLYVGLTMNLDGRLAKHRRKAWWPEVVDVTLVWFEGREAAKAAERQAIRTESPIHNIVRPSLQPISEVTA